MFHRCRPATQLPRTTNKVSCLRDIPPAYRVQEHCVGIYHRCRMSQTPAKNTRHFDLHRFGLALFHPPKQTTALLGNDLQMFGSSRCILVASNLVSANCGLSMGRSASQSSSESELLSLTPRCSGKTDRVSPKGAFKPKVTWVQSTLGISL